MYKSESLVFLDPSIRTKHEIPVTEGQRSRWKISLQPYSGFYLLYGVGHNAIYSSSQHVVGPGFFLQHILGYFFQFILGYFF
jgi:hypothetical protein